MDLMLKDLRALVTGASRGLGFAAAQLLVEEGARVAINGRSMDSLKKAAVRIQERTGQPVLILDGDASNPAVPEKLVRATAEAMGGLDILITNTGGPPAGTFENFEDEAWLNAFQSNLMSHVRLIRSALPWLKRSRAASVLTMTSYTVRQPLQNLILSNSIRSATTAMTKTLSQELGGEGIRFNAILPGWTETERVTYLIESRARRNNTSVEEERERLVAEIPLGRLGTPEEFARAAVFLVSPAASYINGVLLPVDGGIIRGI